MAALVPKDTQVLAGLEMGGIDRQTGEKESLDKAGVELKSLYTMAQIEDAQ